MASLPEHLMPVSVGREPLPREVIASHQRERVLGAATEVFAKRGYQSTTVDHIVVAAKINVGRFYSLFAGKEDCLLRAYESILAELRAHLAAAIPPARPWPEQACAALSALLGYIAAAPLKAKLAFVELQTAGPGGLQLYGQALAETTELLRGARVIATVDPPPPPKLEEAIASGLFWLLSQRLVRSEVTDIELLLPEVVEFVLEPYIGSAAAREQLAAALSAPR